MSVEIDNFPAEEHLSDFAVEPAHAPEFEMREATVASDREYTEGSEPTGLESVDRGLQSVMERWGGRADEWSPASRAELFALRGQEMFTRSGESWSETIAASGSLEAVAAHREMLEQWERGGDATYFVPEYRQDIEGGQLLFVGHLTLDRATGMVSSEMWQTFIPHARAEMDFPTISSEPERRVHTMEYRGALDDALPVPEETEAALLAYAATTIDRGADAATEADHIAAIATAVDGALPHERERLAPEEAPRIAPLTKEVGDPLDVPITVERRAAPAPVLPADRIERPSVTPEWLASFLADQAPLEESIAAAAETREPQALVAAPDTLLAPTEPDTERAAAAPASDLLPACTPLMPPPAAAHPAQESHTRGDARMHEDISERVPLARTETAAHITTPAATPEQRPEREAVETSGQPGASMEAVLAGYAAAMRTPIESIAKMDAPLQQREYGATFAAPVEARLSDERLHDAEALVGHAFGLRDIYREPIEILAHRRNASSVHDDNTRAADDRRPASTLNGITLRRDT